MSTFRIYCCNCIYRTHNIIPLFRYSILILYNDLKTKYLRFLYQSFFIDSSSRKMIIFYQNAILILLQKCKF